MKNRKILAVAAICLGLGLIVYQLYLSRGAVGYLFHAKALESFGQGDLRKGVRLYNIALLLNPSDETFLYNRGIFYAQLGDVGAARRDLNKVLKLYPSGDKSRNARIVLEKLSKAYSQPE